MMMEALRYYSGKYDSTKQRYAYREFETEAYETKKGLRELYLRYTTSLRLEMLFTRQIVLTDAQWYDGLYFASFMQNESEFDKFLNINQALNSPLFEVKRRESYVPKMFGKPFEFSSLLDARDREGTLAYHVYNCGIEKGERIAQTAHTMADYMTILKEDIDASLKGLMEEFEYRMLRLDNPSGISFQPWRNSDALPNLLSSRIQSSPISHREMLIGMLEDALGKYSSTTRTLLQRQVEPIQNQIKQKFPNRSIFERHMAEIMDITEERDTSFKDIRNKFNSIYNRGIAEQHDCFLNDQMDDVFAVEEALNAPKERRRLNLITVAKISNTVVQAIGGCSWDIFIDTFLHNEQLVKCRNNWIKEYEEAFRDPSRKEGGEAIKAYELLANAIIRAFDGLKAFVSQNCSFFDKKNRNLVVANSSNLEMPPFANDIAVFTPYADDRGTLARISTIASQADEMDNLMDTIITNAKFFVSALFNK